MGEIIHGLLQHRVGRFVRQLLCKQVRLSLELLQSFALGCTCGGLEEVVEARMDHGVELGFLLGVPGFLPILNGFKASLKRSRGLGHVLLHLGEPLLHEVGGSDHHTLCVLQDRVHCVDHRRRASVGIIQRPVHPLGLRGVELRGGLGRLLLLLLQVGNGDGCFPLLRRWEVAGIRDAVVQIFLQCVASAHAQVGGKMAKHVGLVWIVGPRKDFVELIAIYLPTPGHCFSQHFHPVLHLFDPVDVCHQQTSAPELSAVHNVKQVEHKFIAGDDPVAVVVQQSHDLPGSETLWNTDVVKKTGELGVLHDHAQFLIPQRHPLPIKKLPDLVLHQGQLPDSKENLSVQDFLLHHLCSHGHKFHYHPRNHKLELQHDEESKRHHNQYGLRAIEQQRSRDPGGLLSDSNVEARSCRIGQRPEMKLWVKPARSQIPVTCPVPRIVPTPVVLPVPPHHHQRQGEAQPASQDSGPGHSNEGGPQGTEQNSGGLQLP
mmetsp:Transcript_73938/g.197047  ORF Transcript_73938/g.197047 Transcript_73938/m.197047 type:complete len:488 (-) Transcript_73938:1003-2466(-)